MKKNILRCLAPFTFYFFVIGCTEDAGTMVPSSDGAYLSSATGGGASGGGGASSGAGGSPGQSGNAEAGVITAGEWNDLEEWSFWMSLMNDERYSVHSKTWGINPANRYSFILKDANNRPVADAQFVLKDDNGQELWAARSDNFGKAELWPGVFNAANVGTPASVVVSYQDQQFTFDQPTSYNNGINEIKIPVTANDLNLVEVMLIIDATGSMADELEYLKIELYDVLERAQQADASQLRTASVFYRDQGDEYVTRVSPFTSNVIATVEFVKSQSAMGGGDFPEAVHSALENGVQQENWSANARTRLLFLMLDAPPHENAEVKLGLQELCRQAARSGIKIIPVTASGIDKNTEFLMRCFSIATNGTYVFITNHSGIGNEHIEPTIGEYEVEYLNDLMVRLIKKYSE